MIDAFDYSKKKKFDFIIVWGSDIPSLTWHDIAETLKFHDSACLIPALDGGYSLIAINAKYFRREIFEKIAWSTKKTFLMQKKRFNDLDIPLHVMSPVPDLDTAKDIIKNIAYMQKSDSLIYKKRLLTMSSFWESEAKKLK